MKLTDTQQQILTAAAAHDALLAAPPGSLPAAARHAVIRSMLKNNLLAEISPLAEHAALAWRQDEAGAPVALRITEAGLRAIGMEPGDAEPNVDEPNAVALAESGGRTPKEYEAEQGLAQATLDAGLGAENIVERAMAAGFLPPGKGVQANTPTGVIPVTAEVGQVLAALDCPLQAEAAQAPAQWAAKATPLQTGRTSLRDAATAVLTAWDVSGESAGMEQAITTLRTALAITALRAALAGKAPRQPRQSGAPRVPREGTKQEAVLALLRRPEGATVAQVAEATGWQHHTVRGFFAGLKKRQGITVEVLERVRQVGAEGAKGSYTVYRIADAG